jgi:ABC-2 type transport system permease protein
MNNRILAIVKKEILHVLRDPRSLTMAIGMPIVLLFLFGYAITLDIDNVYMAVCDFDKSLQSREFISSFTSSGYFKIISFVEKEEHLNLLLDRGYIKVGIIIPPGFKKKLSVGKPCDVQVLIDGVESNSANVIIGYVKGITYLFSSKVLLNFLNKQGISNFKNIPNIEGIFNAFYNPDLKSRNFIIPGLIAVIMTVIMTVLTSLTIVREKEKGTFEQLIITPVKPYELMLGKIAPYWVIGMIDMIFVTVVGVFIFHVPLKGSILLLFFITGIFAFSGLGIGLLISVISNSQQVANLLAMIFSFLPVFLLSGFMFPIKSMPSIIQYITVIIPAKYFLTVLRGIFLKGSGLYILLTETLVLLIFGVILIGIASLKFKKKLR